MSQINGLDLTAHALTNMTRLYYSHQIKGMEKIPSSGGAILVWYHGIVPIDYVALVAQLYLRDGRMINSIVHRSEWSTFIGPDFEIICFDWLNLSMVVPRSIPQQYTSRQLKCPLQCIAMGHFISFSVLS